jgi:prophage tail gpP-like protein
VTPNTTTAIQAKGRTCNQSLVDCSIEGPLAALPGASSISRGTAI